MSALVAAAYARAVIGARSYVAAVDGDRAGAAFPAGAAADTGRVGAAFGHDLTAVDRNRSAVGVAAAADARAERRAVGRNMSAVDRDGAGIFIFAAADTGVLIALAVHVDIAFALDDQGSAAFDAYAGGVRGVQGAAAAQDQGHVAFYDIQRAFGAVNCDVLENVGDLVVSVDLYGISVGVAGYFPFAARSDGQVAGGDVVACRCLGRKRGEAQGHHED